MVDLAIFSRIDFWSFAAVPVEVDRDGRVLSHGTAFFYMWHEQTYLVTAWHVLTGRNFQDGQALTATAATPNHITIHWNVEGHPGYPKTPQRIPLFSQDEEPLWTEIKNGKQWVDVVILPINVPSGSEAYPVNELPERSTNQGIGGDLFIIGFPLRNQPMQLPIWKRASLASEPAIPDELQPYWLVDTASRSGMSGAPVVQRVYPTQPSTEDFLNRLNNPGHQGATTFEGVYSGRFKGATEEDAQLGIVWPFWWVIRLIKERIGDTAYNEGLLAERARRTRVDEAFAHALKHGGRARPR